MNKNAETFKAKREPGRLSTQVGLYEICTKAFQQSPRDETKGKFLVDNKKQEDTEMATITEKKSSSSTRPATTPSQDEEKCCDRQQIAPY